MTCEKFESVIGYHCSPVLMGMKPANLVSFSKERMPAWSSSVDMSSGALFGSKLTGSFSAEAGVLSVSPFVLAASGIEEAGAVLVSAEPSFLTSS